MVNNDKQAFNGRAEVYAKSRPDYPSELYEELLAYWRKYNEGNDEPLVVDVGCGTGIGTRAIYHALQGRAKVYGIEPGHDMRAMAQTTTTEKINYIEGSAEALPFTAATVNILTAAQAAQWFERKLFYAEAQRILTNKGVIAIYENNRAWERSPFLLKYEEFLEQYAYKKDGSAYSRYYRDFPYEHELQHLFREVMVRTYYWERDMTANEFLLMAKSSTQVKRAIQNIGEQTVCEMILTNISQHFSNIRNIRVLYNTKLYMAKK